MPIPDPEATDPALLAQLDLLLGALLALRLRLQPPEVDRPARRPGWPIRRCVPPPQPAPPANASIWSRQISIL